MFQDPITDHDGQFKVLRLTSDTSFAAEFAADRDLIGSERTSA